MSFTRFASSVALTCAALAVALPGCSSDQPEPGVGNLDMAVTLAQPPSGPNEQIDTVDVSLYCEGIDPILGSPRPPMSAPEKFTINVATSQGPEPKNTIGLLEKQGLPAGKCVLTFNAVSNTGNTECNGEIEVMIQTDQTEDTEVVLACIHTPRYGGLRTDGTFNQCAEYRQILVTPTTQSIGNLVDVATEVYDPDGDEVTVGVQAVGACSNVVGNFGSAASCGLGECETVVNTVECTDVGLCQIIVALSDDGFDSCTGLLPDGSNNNAARRTIDVDCTIAQGCGNGSIDPGEDCDPPDGVFCDENCQDIDPCAAPDACDQSDVCSPEVCSADPVDNTAVCTPDPASAAGNACSPPTGGTCDGQGNCVACTQNSDCEDNNDCTDNFCVAGACEFPPDDTNQCSVGGNPGTCNAGVCEGLCSPDTCPDNGIECVTDFCDPADGSCNPQNDGINTGCDLGGGPGSGVCDGAGTCFECNIDAQCAAGETCVNNVCEVPAVNLCTTTAQAFVKTLDPNAGFATTNNIVFDTTDLPETWGTYTVTLDLSDPALEGQILQFGYQTLAKDFQPAGNFYDNNVAAVAGYIQDFNGLDPTDPNALSGDGWLYFANVYDGDGNFKFNFGQTFPAPTTSGQISAIAVGEGGPDQNPNQLVVFSNYDCCQSTGEGHFNGTDLVETIVFQEPLSDAEGGIPQSWIGQTFEFTFDAKRGNINDPNAEACQPPPPPGGELTVNGDFETGDFTGWTNFCDNGAGSCTITSDNPNNGQFAARRVTADAPAERCHQAGADRGWRGRDRRHDPGRAVHPRLGWPRWRRLPGAVLRGNRWRSHKRGAQGPVLPDGRLGSNLRELHTCREPGRRHHGPGRGRHLG